MSDAYFEPLGPGRYRATDRTGGAWSLTEQHISPLMGLVVHEIERAVVRDDGTDDGTDDGLVLARFGCDILGVVGIEELEVAVEVLRPGRTIQLVEAVVTWAGRTVLRARAWRLAATDTSAVAGGAGAPLPTDLPAWDMSSLWPGGYIASLDVRRDPDAVPGRARAWVASPLDLVDGVEVSDLARFVMLVDTANGLAVRESPQEWAFPNVDLTLHLHRQPVAGPVGFDVRVTFGPDGQGLTSTVLHDRLGPVGTLAQVLTVRAAPSTGQA